MAKYYTLCTLDQDTGTWHPQFGDYDLEVVKDEYDSYQDQGEEFLLILKTADDQASINARLASLNNAH